MFQRFWPQKSQSPHIKAYKSFRKLSRDTATTVLETYVDDKALTYIGRTLGIQQGKTLTFEDEREVETIMDFLMYEYRVDGLRMVDRYVNDHPDLSEQEQTLFNSMRNNYLSLFQIVQTNPAENTVSLMDILGDRGNLDIIDLGLSRSVADQDYLIFTRVIFLEDFNMTSGLFFIFPGEYKDILVKRHKTLMKRVKSESETVQRFVAFFKLNRTEGVMAKTAEI